LYEPSPKVSLPIGEMYLTAANETEENKSKIKLNITEKIIFF
jgi:hypothetical protein